MHENLDRLDRGTHGNAAVVVVAAVLLIGCLVAVLLLRTAELSRLAPSAGETPIAEESTREGPVSPGTEIPDLDPAPATAEATEPTLEPPSLFHGTVTTPEGAPIEGAHVRSLGFLPAARVHQVIGDEVLLVPADPAGPRAAEATILAAPMVTTDAEGTFELPGDAGGSLLISAEGFAPLLVQLGRFDGIDVASIDHAAELRDALVRTREREYVLTPATLITGTVTSRIDGSPAVGVEVIAMENHEGGILGMAMAGLLSETRARVNAEGTYGIWISDSGEYQVGARSGVSEFAPIPVSRWTRQLVERGDLSHRIDFVVSPGGVIEGRLISGRQFPITAGTVGVLPDLQLTELASASMSGELDPRRMDVGEDGSFRIGGLPLGRAYRVMAEAAGHAHANAVTRELTEVDPYAFVEVNLVRGSTISGTVIIESGEPAPGVQVRLAADLQTLMKGGFAAAASAAVEPTVSGDDGSFTLEHISAGEYRLLAGKDEMDFNPFAPAMGEAVEVDGESDLSGVVLVTAPSFEGFRGDLTGRVVDGEGRPLAGVTVKITGNSETTAEGAPVAVSGSLVSTQSVDDPELVLVTDRSGAFDAPGMAFEGAMIEVTLATYASEFEVLAAGQTEVEIVLEAVGVVRGRVVLADGSAPTVPFRVVAELVGESAGGFQEQIAQMVGGDRGEGDAGNEDGTFELTEVPIGLVEIVARAPGLAPARSNPLQVQPGSEITGVVLVLTRGASIFGQVVDPDGTPLGGAKIFCLPSRKASALNDLMARMLPALAGGEAGVVTGSDGSYVLSHLEPGEYLIRAVHESFARSEPAHITVRSEEEKGAPAIAMLLGGVVEGVVLRSGTPSPGMMAQIFSGGTFQQAMTDAEGAFRFENLPDGEHALMFMDLANAMRPGGGSGIRTRTVEVGAGETTTLEIAFGTGQTVRGTVENHPGGAMRMVTLRRPGGPAPEEMDPLDMEAAVVSARYQIGMAMLGPDGEFAIADIEPGEYILEIPALPDDPTDLQAYQEMDRTPLHRETITVRESDVTLSIRL